jgi:hypothetical protein
VSAESGASDPRVTTTPNTKPLRIHGFLLESLVRPFEYAYMEDESTKSLRVASHQVALWSSANVPMTATTEWSICRHRTRHSVKTIICRGYTKLSFGLAAFEMLKAHLRMIETKGLLILHFRLLRYSNSVRVTTTHCLSNSEVLTAIIPKPYQSRQ